MENENAKNAQLNTVDEYGSSTTVYPATTAANVAIAPTPQIDKNATILQELLWKLKNAATYSVNDETDDPEEDDKVLWSAAKMKEYILESTYPIGSIYMSVNETNPSELFGGTWQAWGKGRVPLGVDPSSTNNTFKVAEGSGGAVSVLPTGSVGSTILSVNQIPSHRHSPFTPYQTTGNPLNPTGTYYHYYPEYCGGSYGSCRAINVSPSSAGTVTVFGVDKADSGSISGGVHPSIEAHTKTAAAGGSTGHTHTLSMKSISTLQPYITCYMWKRVEDPVEPEEVEENPPQQER